MENLNITRIVFTRNEYLEYSVGDLIESMRGILSNAKYSYDSIEYGGTFLEDELGRLENVLIYGLNNKTEFSKEIKRIVAFGYLAIYDENDEFAEPIKIFKTKI